MDCCSSTKYGRGVLLASSCSPCLPPMKFRPCAHSTRKRNRGLELAFQRVPGVVATSVGYTQGSYQQPSYSEVCSGASGHTEAVQVCWHMVETAFVVNFGCCRFVHCYGAVLRWRCDGESLVAKVLFDLPYVGSHTLLWRIPMVDRGGRDDGRRVTQTSLKSVAGRFSAPISTGPSTLKNPRKTRLDD